MQSARVAVIGGTGVGSRLATLPGRRFCIPTEYGPLRGREVEWEETKILTIERHAAGHKLLPHLINYRAAAAGLRQLGVSGCLSTAAVGCLRPEWSLGTFCAVTDFLDFTGRNLTMHGRKVVHDDMGEPFSLAGSLIATAHGLGLSIEPSAVYACTNGPRYESRAEIRAIASQGGDLVGMTATTEAVLMREAGVPYGCLAVVTNLAAGLGDQPLHHGEVTDVMENRGDDILRLLMSTARSVAGSLS